MIKVSKEIIKAINEEISGYDYLNNDEYLEEQKLIDLLENEDFQKQFVTDFILGKTDKYRIVDVVETRISGDYETDVFEDASYISIEHSVDIEYKYDPNKEPIKFNLYFDSDGKTSVSVDGQITGDGYHEEKLVSSWFSYIDWNDIDVTIYSMDGDEIEFTAFNKASRNIQEIFVREFMKEVITGETGLEIREK